MVKNNIIGEAKGREILVATPYAVVSDYNCIYHSAGGTFMSYHGVMRTLPEWKIASGQDANSINSDPLIVNVQTADFSLQAGSPCINAGTSVGLTMDRLRHPIVGPPDFGAYEWQGTVDKSQLQPPTPISPPMGAVNQPTTTILQWSPVTNATGYDVFLATDPQFVVPVVQDLGLNETSRTATLAAGSVYYWRVRGRNEAGPGFVFKRVRFYCRQRAWGGPIADPE